MKKGNKVFLYLDKSRNNPELVNKLGGTSYDRIRGEIIKMYDAKGQMSAIEIEKFFAVHPGSEAFAKMYTLSPNYKRAVMKTIGGEHQLIVEEMWENKGPGDLEYMEVIPNSVDFLLGDD